MHVELGGWCWKSPSITLYRTDPCRISLSNPQLTSVAIADGKLALGSALHLHKLYLCPQHPPDIYVGARDPNCSHADRVSSLTIGLSLIFPWMLLFMNIWCSMINKNPERRFNLRIKKQSSQATREPLILWTLHTERELDPVSSCLIFLSSAGIKGVKHHHPASKAT